MLKLIQLLFFFLVSILTVNGQWFTQYVVPFNNDLFSVKFIGTQIGWAVGKDGAIYRTVDGGTEWYPQEGNTSESLNSIYVFDQDAAFIVGNGGTILKTIDGGSVWEVKTSGTTNNLNSVCFIDENTGWAVGDEGKIIKTIDGGINWSPQVNDTTRNLLSVYFANKDTGWTAGYNSTILKTTNGGINWFAQLSGGDNLYSIFFVNSDTGWAVGVYGKIVNTTNGGINWNPQTGDIIHTLDRLWSVHFVDGNYGWAVGDYGRVTNTINGGNIWRDQSSLGFSIYLFSVYFANKYIGWAVGDGIIRKTINGGGIFTTSMINASASAGSQMLEVASTEGFSVGDNIVINPDGENEETNTITGFGSILLQTPLQFNHQAGELILYLSPTSVKESYMGDPKKYTLFQNYPNPFNPATSIKYAISSKQNVTLKVYDVLGNETATLVNEEMEFGYHSLDFDGSDLPSGVYFYQLKAGSFIETKKMLLLK